MFLKRSSQLLGAFMLASFMATEVFAWTRAFHPALGAPLTHAGVWPVYHPLAVWSWAWWWAWSAPGAFQEAGIAFAMVFGVLTTLALWPAPTGKPQARWATRRDL